MDSEILTDTASSQESRRPPPKAMTLLLPVWGYRFVSQFLEFCLPTLLAPGNIPALVDKLPTRFVVLSRTADEELIQSHPTWSALKQVCTAEIEFIDDLITAENHTTTITLALARMVRRAQENMTDTCFVFLMSDYLFADGSLRTLVRHFLAGASGIVAGNFQVIAEEASSALPYNADPVSRALTFSSRDLLAWSLGYLHPATMANVVNFGLTHNAHINRLLWRVDENTFIGRFYLIHPIGIRPEVTDFVVGSSLDYSFIPEMCPSGNVVTLTDSDDYFIVEMQPRRHEAANLRPGPIEEDKLAASLTEWTTVQHRANVAQTIVYHAAEIPPNLPEAIAEADAFVDRIAASIAKTTPQPWRNHPYWIGAIASNRSETGQALSREEWLFLLGETLPRAGLRGLLSRTRRRVFGVPPDVTRFHTRWPDYNVPREALRQVLSDNGKLLLVTDRPIEFAQWLMSTTNDIYTVEWDRLLHAHVTEEPGGVSAWYSRLLDNFDACLIVATEPMLAGATGVLERLKPLLKAGSRIFVMVINDRPYHNAIAFREIFIQSSFELLDPSSWLLEVHYVHATRLRWLVYRATDRMLLRLRAARVVSPVKLPVLGAMFSLLAVATYFVNYGVRSRSSPPGGLWSSVFLMLRYSEQDSRRKRIEASSALSASGHRYPIGVPNSNPNEGVRPTTAIGPDIGHASILAAHNATAKFLAGRPSIAIYGLDDGGAREIAKANAGQLAIYDPSPRIVKERRVDPGSVLFHDILAEPLPNPYGAICSLGTLAYVSRVDEDVYVGNLAASLALPGNVLILGCPSENVLQEIGVSRSGLPLTMSTEVAADQDEDAFEEDIDPDDNTLSRNRYWQRIQPRTGPQLKALAERFFDNVFLFSIINGVLHPGAINSADYAIVTCCSRKNRG